MHLKPQLFCVSWMPGHTIVRFCGLNDLTRPIMFRRHAMTCVLPYEYTTVSYRKSFDPLPPSFRHPSPFYRLGLEA